MSPYEPRPEGLNTEPAPKSVVETLATPDHKTVTFDAQRSAFDAAYLDLTKGLIGSREFWDLAQRAALAATPTPVAQSAGQEAVAELRRMSEEYQKAQLVEENPNIQRLLSGMRDGLHLAANVVAAKTPQHAAPVNGGEREALREIANWPDGGNRYGQERIKRFAQEALRAADAPQVAASVAEWIAELRRAHEYLDQGKPFFSGKDCAELADLLAALSSPAKEVDWDAVRKAVGKCPAGSYDVESTGTFLTPISSPAKASRSTGCEHCGSAACVGMACCMPDGKPGASAKVGGDEREALLAYVLQDDEHNRLTPHVFDIAYTAFMSAKGKDTEDGGPNDWFTDTRPAVTKAIEKLRKDLFEARAALSADGGERKPAGC